MDSIYIFILGIFLFAIIFFAVRFAIEPLIGEPKRETNNRRDAELAKLRGMGILSKLEIEEVIGLYKKRDDQDEDTEQYHKYSKILNGLREIGYFTDEEYSKRIDSLKVYYKIN